MDEFSLLYTILLLEAHDIDPEYAELMEVLKKMEENGNHPHDEKKLIETYKSIYSKRFETKGIHE